MKDKMTLGDRAERWSPTLALIGFALLLAAALAWLLGGSPEGPRFLTFVQIAATAGAIALLGAIALRPSLWMGVIGIRQVRYGVNTLVMIAAFVAIIGVVNAAALQPRFTREWDLTETQELTLSQPTKDLINGLQKPVQVIGLYLAEQSGQQQQVETLLKRYQAVNDKNLSYHFVDPRTPNALPVLTELGVTSQNDLGLYVLQDSPEGPRHQKVDGTDEQAITTAIYRLITARHSVYFLQGHGELTPSQGLASATSALTRLGYTLNTAVITGTTVPTDASAIIIASPILELKQQEVDALSQYVANGGALMLLVDPDPLIQAQQKAQGLAQQTGFSGPLDTYLRSRWGVTVTNDLVIDRVDSSQGVAVLINKYPGHAITQDFKVPTGLLYARSLQIAATLPEGVSMVAFLNKEAAPNPNDLYGETDLQDLSNNQQPSYDASKDVKAPLNLAVAGTVSLPNDPARFGRLVVIGASSLVADQSGLFDNAQIGNSGLWGKIVTWLVTDATDKQAPPPPETGKQSVPRAMGPQAATPGVSNYVGLSTVCLIPGLVIVAGVVVFLQRRRA